MLDFTLSASVAAGVLAALTIGTAFSLLLIPALLEPYRRRYVLRYRFDPWRMIFFALLIVWSGALLWAGQDVRTWPIGWINALVFVYGILSLAMFLFGAPWLMMLRRVEANRRYPAIFVGVWLLALAVYCGGLAIRIWLFTQSDEWFFWLWN